MNSVFSHGPENWGSIPGRVTQKMVHDAALLNTQHYKVQIKGKWSYQGKSIEPSPTPRFSSY